MTGGAQPKGGVRSMQPGKKGTMVLQSGSSDWGPLVGPWRRYGENPVVSPLGVEGAVQNGPQTILRFRGRWVMLASSFIDHVGHVTLALESDDCLAWRRLAPGFVLRPSEPYEGHYAAAKAAIVVGEELRVYYFGKLGIEERICMAATQCLPELTRHVENPLFTVRDAQLAGQRVFPDSVVRDGATYYHFYDLGFDYRHPVHPRAYRVCVATSLDGVHLADAHVNPVLAPGPDGAWDDAMVSQASVVAIGDWWYLLYSGKSKRAHNKDGQSFGLARARHPLGPWTKYPGNPVFGPAGDAAAWDGAFVQHACPVNVDGRWRLFYNGHGGENSTYRIGIAFPSLGGNPASR